MADKTIVAANQALKDHLRGAEKIKLLLAKRGRLALDLAGVDEALADILGPVRNTRRKRRQSQVKPVATATPTRSNGSQDITLPVRLAFILAEGKNKPILVGDLTTAAQKDGWKTNSAAPNTVVQQALGADSDFVSKGRGEGWALTGRAFATFKKAKRADYATG